MPAGQRFLCLAAEFLHLVLNLCLLDTLLHFSEKKVCLGVLPVHLQRQQQLVFRLEKFGVFEQRCDFLQVFADDLLFQVRL